jgi:transposase
MVLRKIRQILNEALGSLDGEFSKLQASGGRPLIAPERLLRASLLQASFAQRALGMMPQLMEQLDYNLKFRWFVGLGIDDLVWDSAPPR